MSVSSNLNFAQSPVARLVGITTLLFSLAVTVLAAPLPAADVDDARPVRPIQPIPCSRDGVRHLAGLPDVKQGVVGRLWLTTDAIGFEDNGATSWVKSDRILKISLGDQPMLHGGEFGRFLRGNMPLGGNLAIGLTGAANLLTVIPLVAVQAEIVVTLGSQDILTVEFLDAHNGYHAAVFTLPGHHGNALTKILPAANASALESRPHDGCPVAGQQDRSLTLMPIRSQNGVLPAEYRALVYERLLGELQKAQPQWSVLRSGNADDATCRGWKMTLTAKDFHKGNEVQRAMLGPAGLFLGTTRARFEIKVSDDHGNSVWEAEIGSAVRGDRESLDLSKIVAGSVKRKFRKALAAPARQQI